MQSITSADYKTETIVLQTTNNMNVECYKVNAYTTITNNNGEIVSEKTIDIAQTLQPEESIETTYIMDIEKLTSTKSIRVEIRTNYSR